MLDSDILYVCWWDVEKFYGGFECYLLESGVWIFEVCSMVMFLEKVVGFFFEL